MSYIPIQFSSCALKAIKQLKIIRPILLRLLVARYELLLYEKHIDPLPIKLDGRKSSVEGKQEKKRKEKGEKEKSYIMATKRSRAFFEDEAQHAPYVFYGTSLPPADPETRDDGSYVPVWKQEVTDERGRKRLHGAFTGGFSAG